jgi:succinate-semialdehyde dehydrogenase/glutarate-semialdehyde dehydrogenase
VETSGRTFEVSNPATGEIIATLPNFGVNETIQAIAIAHAAQKAWAGRTAKERASVLLRWRDLILAGIEDLALILTMEMGKPLAEARGEIEFGASFVEWFAEEAKRAYGEIIPGHQRDKRLLVIKQPVGVVAAITPWNFPSAMITRKIAPALAAGCAVIAKPAEQTPLSAIALCTLAKRAGLPHGLLNLILTADGPAVGKVLCDDDRVRKISFTGSTEVGRILMRQSADQIKKLSLELGGNAPFIVFDDADVHKAVEGAILAKFRNGGQTCVCANRLYVQSGIHDAFVECLVERVSRLAVGDGLAKGTEIGPLIDEDGIRKVAAHIEDGLSKGAHLLVGGKPFRNCGTFFQPTVLIDVNASMQIAREETFGPLAPVFRFDTVEEVIEQANNTEFGLAAYFYTRDVSRIWTVAEALDCGVVGINTGIISTELAPFGGVKQSGLGREGSRYGIDEYLELKYLCMDIA